MMDAALHAGLGWTVAWLIVAASFATSFITAAFGIGGGAALLAILASLVPPAALIPVHGLVQLGSNVGRAAIMFRYRDQSVLIPFSIGALIGVALGGSVVVQLPPHVIQIGVGLFVLWSVLAKPPAFMRKSAAIAGTFSSFLTMFFGGTGPFVAAFVKSLGHPRMTHVATHAMLMTVQHLLKTIAFGFLGFAFGEWLPLIGAMVASGFLGTVVGKHVLARIDEGKFKLALNTILIVLSLRLIWAGGTQFLGY
ncbi:MAG TPA: sulfite exporter TauE/SafE family protein [Thermohalobaculum sp.]|nr:sulfite exporter TauE/SafE family protein [Thermohalobaculum sp.]